MKKVMKKIMEWIIFELLFAGTAVFFSFCVAFYATVIRYHISLFNIDYSELMTFTLIFSFLTVPVMTIIAAVFKIVIYIEGDEQNHEKAQY